MVPIITVELVPIITVGRKRAVFHVQICPDISDAARQLAAAGPSVDLVFVEFSDAAAAAPLLAAAAAAGGGRGAVAVIGVVAAGDCAAAQTAAAAGLSGTVAKPLDRAQAGYNICRMTFL